jgi:heme/copper-type cytochrome/quinol oxidase subunit 2
MNWKRFLWASLAILVVRKGLAYFIETVILRRDYEKLSDLLRPDVLSTVWLMFIVGLLVAFMFTYIFVKGREGKGIQEGVRFGIVIWLFVTVPTGLGAWMMFPIPIALIGKWALMGLLLNLISGILAAAIYKPAGPAKT